VLDASTGAVLWAHGPDHGSRFYCPANEMHRGSIRGRGIADINLSDIDTTPLAL
jgi:hypothetical protein